MSAIGAVEPLAAPSIALWERLRRLDLIELAVLGSFVLLGLWVLGSDLYVVIAQGGAWTGTDGIFTSDQMQYLAWIRDASRHLLAADLFDLRPTPHDFLQPMVAISGGLVALGMTPSLALLIWKPVALATALGGIRALIHRTVSGVGARRAALAVALFGGTNKMFVDLWLPMWTWDYPYALVALGAALLALLRYERARAAGRLPVAAAALAALAGWLHPWQGEVWILCVIGAEAVMWLLGRRPPLRSLLLVVGVAALPLVYYALLHHFDPSWRFAALSDDGALPIPRIFVWLWPLLIPAALAYRLRPRNFTDAAVRTWPFAAFACFVVNEHGYGSSPFHVFLGITVPLAILAVQGLQSIRWPRGVPRTALAVAAVAAITVPVTIHKISNTTHAVNPGPSQANFMAEGDADALQWVAQQPGSGGVLANSFTGVSVPAVTGRRTYVGDQYWSQPGFRQRSHLISLLLLGWFSPQKARAFVLSTGARYLISNCWFNGKRFQRNPHRLSRLLGPIIQSSHQFDCARVYTIRPRPPRD